MFYHSKIVESVLFGEDSWMLKICIIFDNLLLKLLAVLKKMKCMNLQ